MNSPADFIIYFRLHKIIKVFLFIFVYNFFECDTSWSNLQDEVQASSCMFHSRKWFLSFHLSHFFCCKPCNPLLIFFYFALWNAYSHLAFPQGQMMMAFRSFLNFYSSHCPQAEWWDFSCKKGVCNFSPLSFLSNESHCPQKSTLQYRRHLHPSSLPFSYKHNRTNTTHNRLFTSKHMACRETERVQPALSVG